jgi:phage-related protein
MDEKTLVWVGSALADLRRFPENARRRAGFELHTVQRGQNPSDWKPMPSIGPGVAEIRIHTGTEHRIFYVARFEEAVFVLHAFEKKTQKTAKKDVDLGKARLADVLNSRNTGPKRRAQ